MLCCKILQIPEVSQESFGGVPEAAEKVMWIWAVPSFFYMHFLHNRLECTSFPCHDHAQPLIFV